MNYSINSVTVITFIVSLIIITINGCFITNCPPGGKRSEGAKIRQCEQCGPPGSQGRCYGPSICCSPEFGCMISTPETTPCLMENRFTTLCQNPGSACSGQNGELSSGQCAAENVCCNSETCTMDESCREESKLGSQQYPQQPRLHRYPLDIFVHRLINGQNLNRRQPQSASSASTSAVDY